MSRAVLRALRVEPIAMCCKRELKSAQRKIEDERRQRGQARDRVKMTGVVNGEEGNTGWRIHEMMRAPVYFTAAKDSRSTECQKSSSSML